MQPIPEDQQTVSPTITQETSPIPNGAPLSPTELIEDEETQSERDYALLVEEDGKGLQRELRGVLPLVPPRTRARVVVFLGELCMGKTHKRALDEADLVWGQFRSMMMRNDRMKALYGVAQAIQEVVLKHSREDALQKRGVEGWEEPVWYQGRQVGTVHKYSDKLLQTALEASDEKYRKDRPPAVITAGSVSISFVSQGVVHNNAVGPAKPDNPAIIEVEELPGEPSGE